jgi:hypothetical protein
VSTFWAGQSLTYKTSAVNCQSRLPFGYQFNPPP